MVDRQEGEKVTPQDRGQSGPRFRSLLYLAAGVALYAALLCATSPIVLAEVANPVDAAAPMPVRPAHRSTIKQNPPDFSWPALTGESRWELELKGPGGATQRVPTVSNPTSLPFELASGDYEWRVLPVAGQRGPFRFTVTGDTPRFVVPPSQDLLRIVRDKPHPRFRFGAAAASAEERQRALERARRYIERDREEPPAHSKGWTGSRQVEQARAQRGAKRAGQSAADQLAVAALAWHLSRGEAAIAEDGRRLLLEAASWDPLGATGVASDSLVARDMVWSMALLYDALHARLLPDERRKIVESILARTADIRRAFLDGGRMQRQPFNSHGWVAWAGAAAAATLVAGDDPRADEAFLQLVPGFIASISPWGGPDGGFANGTAYAHHDIGALILPFDIISEASGVDLYTKPWLRNVGRFLTYTLPPGAPEAPFGDGRERVPTPQTALTIRALSIRVPDPLLQWSAGAQSVESKGVSALMLASLGAGNLQAKPSSIAALAPSASFADVGWVAMHNDLTSPGRVSVYFKSSPYGSLAHGHADQNALVLHVAGKPLLKGSGYYDYYDSDHYRNWYKTTKAQNAITFDGGSGQPIRTMSAAGSIVFAEMSPSADFVTGDARQSYAGQLTRALRTIAFIRPNLVLVRDQLASDVPRRWEWNFHADVGMSGRDRSARVEVDNASVCIDVINSPALRFEQADRFSAQPRDSGRGVTFSNQQHGRFTVVEPSLAAEFLVALRVGCAGSTPRAIQDGRNWLVPVTAGGSERLVVFVENRAELR